MQTSRIVALTVLATLTACGVALFVVSAAGMAKSGAAVMHSQWGSPHLRGGCHRLRDVDAGDQVAWLARDLQLDAAQTAAARAVWRDAERVAAALRSVCAPAAADAPSRLAAATDSVGATFRAMRTFADAFAGFYATLDGAQQQRIDGWFADWPRRRT
jgi:LTXXQ motif family protein